MRDAIFRREGGENNYIVGKYPEWSDVAALRTGFVIFIY